MTLNDLLALLPDNSTGDISASDMRTVVTGLWNHEVFYNSYSWQYSNAALPPTGNQVRANNSDLAQATVVEFRKLDNDGNDRSGVLSKLKAEDRLRLSDWNNAATYHRFRVTGASTVTTDTVQVPVLWLDGAGTIPNAKAEVELLLAVTL